MPWHLGRGPLLEMGLSADRPVVPEQPEPFLVWYICVEPVATLADQLSVRHRCWLFWSQVLMLMKTMTIYVLHSRMQDDLLDYNLVVVGKTGSGKSWVCNRLLGVRGRPRPLPCVPWYGGTDDYGAIWSDRVTKKSPSACKYRLYYR